MRELTGHDGRFAVAVLKRKEDENTAVFHKGVTSVKQYNLPG